MCTHADNIELVIGLDYPPSEQYVDGWKKIKDYIHTITGFKKVTVFERERNYGVLGSNSNIACLEKYAFEHYDAVIATEDDNVFSPCFLDYMNKGLEKYKDDDSVIAVSGYMNPVSFGSVLKTGANVVHMQDYMAWGIGYWKRTDEELKKRLPLPYLPYVCGHRHLLKRMRGNLRELSQLIFWIKGKPELDCRCDFVVNCYNI